MTAAPRACPICGKPVKRASRWMPFCGQRCRTQDLANWATGIYAIPVPSTEADENWATPQAHNRPAEDDE